MSDYRVKPLSRTDIEIRTMEFLRKVFPQNLQKPKKLNVIELLEFQLDKLYGIRFLIDDSIVQEGIEADLLPDERLIRIAPKVYNNLVNEDGRSRFTICHEIGHVLLHLDQFIGKKKSKCEDVSLTRKYIEPFRSSEWQANFAAGAILMPKNPTNILKEKVFSEGGDDHDLIIKMMNTFGVSCAAAETRCSKI